MSSRGSRTPRAKSSRFKRLAKRGFVAFAILFTVATVAGLCVWIPIYKAAQNDALDIERKLVVHSSNPSVMVSSDGSVLYRIAMQRRTVVDVMDLPAYVRYAVVAAEDRRFFDHKGVDYHGLLRIGVLAVREGRASQGASTIEMQLAKNLVNGDERTFQRKLKDIATAQQIENLKSKAEILNLYMNEVYFGQGAFGIEAAAETYFGKHAKKLTISEAAMLARCVRHPSRENPVKDLQGSIDRRNYVLGVMRDENWITPEEYSQAIEENPKLDKSSPQGVRWMNPRAGYFVDHVLAQFHNDFPSVDLQEGGYRIETTLNLRLQEAAVAALQRTLANHGRQKVTNGAMILMDSQGRILAEVGGKSYSRSKFNIITSGKLQPGSSFKPFVYATALKEGAVHMGEMLSNAAIYEDRYGNPWNPKNNGRERIGGTFSLSDAFALSVNLPAIHTIQKVGPETVVSYAKDTFGFTSHLVPFESLAIGTAEVTPLEMIRGYSVFMLQGDRLEPYPIARVVSPGGEVKEYQPQRIATGFDPEVCREVDELMQGVVLRGTGTAAAVVPDARGKTGTTQDARDAWFCGYSDGVLGVAWVGNSGYRHGRAYRLPMSSSVYGGTVTAGMWAEVLNKAHALHLCHQLPPPQVERVAARTEKHASDGNRVEVVPDPNVDGSDGSSSEPKTVDEGPTVPITQPPSPPPRVVQPPTDSGDSAAQDNAPAVPPQPAPDPPRRHRRPPPKSTGDESDYVEVQICADTGMRASRYCPETVPRRFKRGTEPRQICRMHTGD